VHVALMTRRASKGPDNWTKMRQGAQAAPDTGRMRQEVAEDPAALVRLIETTEDDFGILIWAAGAINACLLKQGPVASYAAAFDEFKQPEGMKYLPETWLNRDVQHESPPEDAALVIARRIEQLSALDDGISHHHAMEASAWLLNSLLELVRDNQRHDAEKIRKLLLTDSQPVSHKQRDQPSVRMSGFRGALITTMTAKAMDTDDITTNRDVAFLAGIHLLAHLTEGDQEVAFVLQRCRLPEMVCDRIFHKASLQPADLWRRKLPLRWEAFAAASCHFLQLYLEARPGPLHILQYRKKIDAMFAVLEKSFNATASLMPFASFTVHLEHFGAFKVLKDILDTVPSEAASMVDKRGVFFATELLRIEGVHEEAVRLVCGLLSALLSTSPDPGAEARAVGLPKVLDRMLDRYKKYPLGTADLQAQLSKLYDLIDAERLCQLGGPLAATWPGALKTRKGLPGSTPSTPRARARPIY